MIKLITKKNHLKIWKVKYSYLNLLGTPDLTYSGNSISLASVVIFLLNSK